MTVTNLTNIKTGALIAAANPIPFTLSVDSQQQCSVTLTVKNGNTTIASDLEMLNFRTIAPIYYFTIDLKDIISTLFIKSLNDETQTAWEWRNMLDNIYDVTIVATVSNGVDANIVETITFAAINLSKQISNDILICSSPDEIYDIDQYEKLFAGYDNLGYAYILSAADDNVSTFEENVFYFVDSDDIFFIDGNDKMTFEK